MVARARRWSLVIGAAAAVLAAGLAAAPARAAEGSAVGIRPAGQQDWFRLSAAPGQTVSEVALVTNRTAETVPVAIYAVDATVTPQGGFALLGADAPRTGVGAWTAVPIAQAELAPGSVTRVPIRIAIPAGAEPGDYAGGIVVEMKPRTGGTSTIGDGTAVRFNIVERVGVRTFVRVDGTVLRRLELGPMTWRRTRGGIEFRVPVRNTGTVRVEPSGELRVGGWGAGDATIPLHAPELVLPGSSATMTALWKEAPALARITAEASVRYGEAPLRTSISIWFVPWRLGLAALAFLLAGIWVARRVWRFATRARGALRLIEGGRRGTAVHAPAALALVPPPEAAPGPSAAAPVAGATHAPEDEAHQWLSMLFGDDGPEGDAAAR